MKIILKYYFKVSISHNDISASTRIKNSFENVLANRMYLTAKMYVIASKIIV